MFGVTDHIAERRMLERGLFKQLQVFVIDLSASRSGEGQAEIECDVANGVSLETEVWLPGMSSALVSDTTARVYLRFNDKSGPWLPFSLVANAKSKQAFVGTVFRIWVKVPSDAIVAGGKLVFLLSVGCALSSNNGGTSVSGGYSSPSQSGPLTDPNGGQNISSPDYQSGGGKTDYSGPLLPTGGSY